MENVIDVNCHDAQNIEVYWQEDVTVDLDLALLYVKSGQQEIQTYVNEVSKPEISRYTDEYAKPIVTKIVDDLARPQVADYVENEVKPQINDFADKQMSGYASQAALSSSEAQKYAQNAAESADVSLQQAQQAAQAAERAASSETHAAQSAQEAAASAKSINVDNLLHKTGSETKNGNLALQNGRFSAYSASSNTGVDIVRQDTARSDAVEKDTVFGNIHFNDKNNQVVGYVQTYRNSNGDNNLQLAIADADGNMKVLRVQSDGLVFVPKTPAVTDKTQAAVTTNFVANKFQLVDALPAEPVAGVFYFVKE